PSEPVFHAELLPYIKGTNVSVQAMLEVFGMDTLAPPVTNLVLHRPASEIEPGLIKVTAEFIRAGHPDHDRCRICHPAEPRFALAACYVGPLPRQRVGKYFADQLQTLYQLVGPVALLPKGGVANPTEDLVTDVEWNRQV